MSSTRNASIHSGSQTITLAVPQFTLAVTYTGDSDVGVGPGTLDVPATLNAGIAANSLTGASYDGGQLPTPPSGSAGLAIDPVAGSALYEPADYTAVVDVAAGANTVVADASQAQSVLLGGDASYGFFADGGSGTVLGAGAGDLFYLQQATYTVRGAGGGDTVSARNSQSDIALVDGNNAVFLLGGVNKVVLGGGDTVVALSGNQSINEFGPGLFQFVSGITYFGAHGSTGAQTVFGGTGYTTLSSDEGGVLAVNGSGAMRVYLGQQARGGPSIMASTVFGGTGSVTITGGEGHYPTDATRELFVGGSAGQNAITVRGGADSVFGGGDGDVLTTEGGSILVAGPGAETIKGVQGGFDLIAGGSGPDVISGALDDTIFAGGGNTTVFAEGGITQLGSGLDLVISTAASTVVGGTGAAGVYNAGGSLNAIHREPMLVLGGAGIMTFVNQSTGASTLHGGSGSVTVDGGPGGGVYSGGTDGHNALNSGAGQVTLFAAGEADTLTASGSAADVLVASSGNQTLVAAGTGSDILQGGSGQTQMVAGDGADVFAFAQGAGGAATISGFVEGRDAIALQGFGASPPPSASFANGAITLTLADNTRITVLGLTHLAPGDFV